MNESAGERAFRKAMREAVLPFSLFLVLAVLIMLIGNYDYSKLLEELPAHLLTGAITILIVNFIYDYRIARTREERITIAMRLLRPSLRSVLRMWFQLANEGTVPHHDLEKLRKCLNEEQFYDRLKWVDFKKPLNNFSRSRKEEVPLILNNFKKEVVDVMLRISQDLDTNANATLTYFSIQTRVHLKIEFYLRTILDAIKLPACSQITDPQFREYFTTLIKLLDFYNVHADTDGVIDGVNLSKLDDF